MSEGYKPSVIKIELALCDEVEKKSFSWDVYSDDHLGTYIKLRSSGSGMFEKDYFLYGNRLYSSYNSMLAKADGSPEVTKIK